MTSDFDVIISGAGPAGCTAALALGSSGLSVALIEKERFPREKVCGDAIPAYAPKVLATIDPMYRAALEQIQDKKPVSICRYAAPDRTALDIAFREKGMVCRRSVFDSFLLDLASRLDNLTVLMETRIKDIRASGRSVAVSTGNGDELTAKLFIGCDGSAGISKRILAPSIHKPSEGSVAVRAYFSGVKDNPDETLEFHFLKELLPGYFWIFPLPGNEFNAGIGMPSAIVTSGKINLRDTLTKIIETDPVIGPRFSGASMKGNIKGHYLPLFTCRRKISGERFMLCGDAASLVNPATGAGIGQAMQSRRYAAWQAVECFHKNDFSGSFMKSYEKILSGKLWRTNRNYMIIKNLVLKNPAVLNLASRAGNSNLQIRRALAEWL